MICRYEQLTRLYPEVTDYKQYQAQALYKVSFGHTSFLLLPNTVHTTDNKVNNQLWMVEHLIAEKKQALVCPIQAGLHQDAAKLAVGLESQEQSLTLQIAIKYEQNDIAGQPQPSSEYMTHLLHSLSLIGPLLPLQTHSSTCERIDIAMFGCVLHSKPSRCPAPA